MHCDPPPPTRQDYVPHRPPQTPPGSLPLRSPSSVCSTGLPSPDISGPRSPGHGPEIAHCQIRSRSASSAGAPHPYTSLPALFPLPGAPPCPVPRPAGPPDARWPRRGRRPSRPQGGCGAGARLGSTPVFRVCGPPETTHHRPKSKGSAVSLEPRSGPLPSSLREPSACPPSEAAVCGEGRERG